MKDWKKMNGLTNLQRVLLILLFVCMVLSDVFLFAFSKVVFGIICMILVIGIGYAIYKSLD